MDDITLFESQLLEISLHGGRAMKLAPLAKALLNGSGLTLEGIKNMRLEELGGKIKAACKEKGITDIFSADRGAIFSVWLAAHAASSSRGIPAFYEKGELPMSHIKRSADALDLDGRHSAMAVAMFRAREAIKRNAPKKPVERTQLKQTMYSC